MESRYRLLLSRLAPAKPSSELHGCRARTSSSGFVGFSSSRSSSVSSPITLSLVTSSTGSSRSSWPSFSGSLSLQSRGDNFWGQVQVVTQILNSLVGQVPVVMAPSELLLHVTAGFKGSEGFNDLQVRNSLQLRVLGSVEILLSHHHALFEEVLVDGNTVLLRHQHPEVLTSLVEVNQAILAWSFYTWVLGSVEIL